VRAAMPQFVILQDQYRRDTKHITEEP